MQDHRDTDERLRQRLNSDQVSRERMCISVLALDARYTQIEPRRPEGGPDQGRDLQAVFDGRFDVYGAVAFINSATDSAAELRQISQKFEDDLDSALTANSELRGFVFFTNIDLTPGERDIMIAAAHAKGVVHVDIYWRERLRQALDSTPGLGLRFTYLRMPLTEAEQISFFNSYGKDVERAISRHRDEMHAGIRRLEYLHWMSRPVRDLSLHVQLNRNYSVEELGHFRIAMTLARRSGGNGLMMGGCDSHVYDTGPTHRDRGIALLSVVSFPTLNHPQYVSDPFPFGSRLRTQFAELNFGARMDGDSIATADRFEGCNATLFFTEKLASKIEITTLRMNGYVVSEIRPRNAKRSTEGIRWAREYSAGCEQEPWFQCESDVLFWLFRASLPGDPPPPS